MIQNVAKQDGFHLLCTSQKTKSVPITDPDSDTSTKRLLRFAFTAVSHCCVPKENTELWAYRENQKSSKAVL
jgi:hypothetical protein